MTRRKIVVAAILVMSLLTVFCTACGEVEVTSSTPANETSADTEAADTTVDGPTESETIEEPVVEEPAAPELTMGQKQAIAKGEDYLDYTAFSRQGLIDQLVFEGFSTDEATFAVDQIAPDWNEQAAQKAVEYLDYSSFSRQGLIDQLVFEGFTQAQAEYGVSAAGY